MQTTDLCVCAPAAAFPAAWPGSGCAWAQAEATPQAPWQPGSARPPVAAEPPSAVHAAPMRASLQGHPLMQVWREAAEICLEVLFPCIFGGLQASAVAAQNSVPSPLFQYLRDHPWNLNGITTQHAVINVQQNIQAALPHCGCSMSCMSQVQQRAMLTSMALIIACMSAGTCAMLRGSKPATNRSNCAAAACEPFSRSLLQHAEEAENNIQTHLVPAHLLSSRQLRN